MIVNKCAILITGQLRTFEECYKSLEEHILSNKEFVFDIYIFTDFYNIPGYKNMYNVNNIDEFKKKIYDVYGSYLKKLYIESEDNIINFPEHINVNKDPRKRNQYKCQYRNYLITKFLHNDNIKLCDYNIIIRMRPDIEFTKKIELHQYYNKNELFIVTRVNSGGNNVWVHNRDWDYCCIGNNTSIMNWVQEWKIIKKLYEETKFDNRLFNNFEYKVIKKCNFNNKGYWEESTKEVNKAIGQLYLNYLASVNQNVIFDLPCNTFAKIKRFN
jgi:hypothetical protein